MSLRKQKMDLVKAWLMSSEMPISTTLFDNLDISGLSKGHRVEVTVRMIEPVREGVETWTRIPWGHHFVRE